MNRNVRLETETKEHPRTADLQGLRAVAAFEALKGALVLLLGFGLLAFHEDLLNLAETLISRVHISPDRPYARVFLHAAGNLSDAHLWAVALGGLTYSGVRFFEAWGLWTNQSWAQYFGILSGAMYLPWEAWEAVRRPTKIQIGLLILNALIVLFLVIIRIRQTTQERSAGSRAGPFSVDSSIV